MKVAVQTDGRAQILLAIKADRAITGNLDTEALIELTPTQALAIVNGLADALLDLGYQLAEVPGNPEVKFFTRAVDRSDG